MAKKPEKSGTVWSPADKQLFKKLVKENTPTRVMGLKLKRTAPAIYAQASELNLSVKPVNQSPYGKAKSKK